MDELEKWFRDVKGSILIDKENQTMYTLSDLRVINGSLYFGILPFGGSVKYVNEDRFDELHMLS